MTLDPNQTGIIPAEPDDTNADPNNTSLQVTPAAEAFAAENGVDLSQVEGTGKDGTITKQDVAAHLAAQQPPPPDVQAAPAEAAVAEAPSGPTAFYYCLEENHPGVPNLQQQPLAVGRIFEVPVTDGAVICPACGREVNAVPAEGPDLPPPSIIELQERFGR